MKLDPIEKAWVEREYADITSNPHKTLDYVWYMLAETAKKLPRSYLMELLKEGEEDGTE